MGWPEAFAFVGGAWAFVYLMTTLVKSGSSITIEAEQPTWTSETRKRDQ